MENREIYKKWIELLELSILAFGVNFEDIRKDKDKNKGYK